MRVAVISEISTHEKNAVIVDTIERLGHEVLNLGMCAARTDPLTYIHTGLLTGIALNAGWADLVIGGCGTGIGYMNSACQYPGVVCGRIQDPLDAWLFKQINSGNCISLALNQGYGWAAEVNLGFVLEKLFDSDIEWGAGFPAHRKESQQTSRQQLKLVSTITHRSMAEVIAKLPSDILKPLQDRVDIQSRLMSSSGPGVAIREAWFARMENVGFH